MPSATDNVATVGRRTAPAGRPAAPSAPAHYGPAPSPWLFVGVSVSAGVLIAAVGAAAVALRSGPGPGIGRLDALRAAMGPHQTAFALRNLHRPWLVPDALATSRMAHARTSAHFGAVSHVDDVGDAFRHAYASGHLTLRLARDRGLPLRTAGRLVRQAGHAHELDGAFNPQKLSSEMDRFNNAVGIQLASLRPGGRWADEAELESRVVNAIRSGELRVLDGAGQLVPTSLP